MEVTDGEGETCYVAVEITFTANARDTTKGRPKRRGSLTSFTGKRSSRCGGGSSPG